MLLKLSRSFLVLWVLLAFYSPVFAAESCSICLETLTDSKSSITTSCGHEFHKSCMVEHVEYQFKKQFTRVLLDSENTQIFQNVPKCTYSCPMCRSTMTDKAHRTDYKFPKFAPSKSDPTYLKSGYGDFQARHRAQQHSSESACSVAHRFCASQYCALKQPSE